MILAAAGIAVLLLSLLVDGISDALDFAGTGSALLSGASIGGLVSGIGLGGMLGEALTDNGLLVALTSTLTGLALAAAGASFYALLQRAQGNEADLQIGGIVGTAGQVRSISRDDPASGTAAVVYLGATRVMQFTASAPLRVGDSVTVTQLVDPETIRVEFAAPGVSQ
ncbi:MAG: hypothetical protein LBL01_05505 [Bifidobacteriaceae bacterium]|nr:hypothetical protein [Bifidobacteriaceae bacterium]